MDDYYHGNLYQHRINSKFQVTQLSQPVFNTPVITGYWRVQTIDSVFHIPESGSPASQIPSFWQSPKSKMEGVRAGGCFP